jgi:hypothetical protein
MVQYFLCCTIRSPRNDVEVKVTGCLVTALCLWRFTMRDQENVIQVVGLAVL